MGMEGPHNEGDEAAKTDINALIAEANNPGALDPVVIEEEVKDTGKNGKTGIGALIKDNAIDTDEVVPDIAPNEEVKDLGDLTMENEGMSVMDGQEPLHIPTENENPIAKQAEEVEAARAPVTPETIAANAYRVAVDKLKGSGMEQRLIDYTLGKTDAMTKADGTHNATKAAEKLDDILRQWRERQLVNEG